MIPAEKVKNIIDKYNSLEKELSSGKFDTKLFAKKSKEYSDLKNIIDVAQEYLNFEKSKKGGRINCENKTVYLSGRPGKPYVSITKENIFNPLSFYYVRSSFYIGPIKNSTRHFK